MIVVRKLVKSHQKRPIIIMKAIKSYFSDLRTAGVFAMLCMCCALSTDANSQVWKIYSFADAFISVEMPFSASKYSLALPEDIRKQVQSISVYKAESAELFTLISYNKYISGVTADARKAAEGAANNLRQGEGVLDFRYNHKLIKVGNRDAYDLTCTYRIGLTGYTYRSVLVAEGDALWQVACVYQTSAKTAETNTNRILKSVQILK